MKNYWLKWTIACGIGEFLGIGVAAGIWFLHFRFLGEPESPGGKVLLLGIMVLAGIIEGSITGCFQWEVLRKRFTRLRTGNWLLFTALGAAAAWLLGMMPSLFFIPESVASSEPGAEPSGWLFAVLALSSGAVLGALFGAFQWIELRRHTTGSGKWIPANLLGWMAGLAIIYLGASMTPEGAGLALIVVTGAASGLLSGLSVGAITGLFLIRYK